MELKTKHRILGILVIVGLVIILFPFFQGSKDIPTQSMSVKAPPFPDQSVQVTTNADATPTQNQTTASADPKTSSAQTTPVIPVPNPIQAKEKDMRETPDDVISVTRPSVVNQKISETENSHTEASTEKKGDAAELASLSNEKSDDDHAQLTKDTADADEGAATSNSDDDQSTASKISTEEDSEKAQTTTTKAVKSKKSTAAKTNSPTMKKAVQITKQPHTKINAKVASSKQSALDEDGLFKLKSAVWVIQLGSFKNKTNALRLVNQLRASGYRAFIQQADANTRVFVGPENKQTIARDIATRLESEMNIKGIVISYKPLTL